MTRLIDILCVGEAMVLGAPSPVGPLDETLAVSLDIAGAEANVASHLARLGVRAGYAGAVGDDAFGRRVIRTLRDRGVDVSLVEVDPAAPTGVFFKDPSPEGSTVLYFRRGSAASRLGPDFARRLPLDRVAWVHLSGITAALSESSLDLVREIIERCEDAGTPTSFDVNHRPALWTGDAAADVLLGLARRCSLVFVGRDEGERLWRARTAEELRHLMPSVPTLVVKDGDVGATAFTGGDVAFAPSLPVDVIEPVGAGDAFAAGYLASTLGGGSPTDALRAGHAQAVAVLQIVTDF